MDIRSNFNSSSSGVSGRVEPTTIGLLVDFDPHDRLA
jgi:hypothetical protein